jgi:hypothetical protein
MSALQAASRNHDWQVVWHEDLCIDTVASFKGLFESTDLTWTPMAGEFLRGSDRPGGRFDTHRVAAEQTRQRWRQRLDPDEVRAINGVLETFPLSYP